jgi:hypothetical protein
MRVNLNIKSALVLVCVVYTLATVTSSGMGLLAGRTTDTHVHLLLRFLVSFIGITSILIFNLFPRWSLPGIFSFHYGATMSVILLLVWMNGFYTDLHPDAYRDIILNYSVIYLIIALGFILTGRLRRKAPETG